jgi:5S rRNA maturation endonuclease (ribonuclease M5)
VNPQEVAEYIAGAGPIITIAGGFKVLCPAHSDNNPSLTITEGTDHPVLMHCHAGCTVAEIVKATGLEWNQILAERERETTGGRRIVAQYDYVDEHGEMLFQAIRFDPKGFAQRRPDGASWVWNLRGVRRILFRLPQIIEAVKNGEQIWVCEGEKDAETLANLGLASTTNPMGAGKWLDEYSQTLAEATVTVVSDKDTAGQAHARAVRENLMKYGARVRIVEAAVGKDATDHVLGGRAVEDFVVTVPFDNDAGVSLALDVDEYLGQDIGTPEFVIDRTLARGEVLMITGFEGHGKSTLLKQIAMMTSFGVHFTTLQPMPPKKVLFIDGENTTMDNYADFKKLRWLADQDSSAARGADREKLFILEPGPINLGDEQTFAWLIERVQGHQPDLIIIGPIYNLVARDLSSEDEARKLKAAIDSARRVCNSAVILEHHVPHESGGIRDTRPIGSSLLLRWPNFGFGLQPVKDSTPPIYDWKPWRGGRRRDREWPSRLGIGGSLSWPWVEVEPE